MDDFDTPQFNKLFWEWFDNLPRQMREKFYYYPADMAKLNFYNTTYKRMRQYQPPLRTESNVTGKEDVGSSPT